MAQRSRRPRQQPFWFPFWSAQRQPPSAPPPPRPQALAPTPPQRPPARPRPQPQPQPSPSPPPRASQPLPAAPPAARRAQKLPSPSPSPSPSTSRRFAHSPSPSPSPSALPSQRPSRPASGPSSPSREAQQPEATLPSLAEAAVVDKTPAAIEEKSPASTPIPLPDTTVQPESIVQQAALHPETQTPDQTSTKQVPEPAETEKTDLEHHVETEPTSKTVPIPAPTPIQHQKIQKEEPEPDSKTSDNQKPGDKPVEIPKETESVLKQDVGTTSKRQELDEKPNIIQEDKTEPEVKPRAEISEKKHDVGTSKQPELDEKPHSIQQDKTKPDVTPRAAEPVKETAKPEPETEQEMEISDKTPKSAGTVVDEPKTEPKTHTKTENQGADNALERELSIMVADTEPEISKHKENESNRKFTKVSISSAPRACSCNGERANFRKEIRDGLSKLVHNMHVGHSGRRGSDQGVTIITLAGKNKGATLFIGDIDEDKRADAAATPSKDTTSNSPIAATVNNNVQSINNSVLNESRCEEGCPGVHLVVSAKPTEIVNLKEKAEHLKTQRIAGSSITIPQKPAHESNVIRRRCLRGLLLEPSDEDLEDATKPRRHGCRVSCNDNKGKEGAGEGTSRS